ncbi:hypothetical protein TMS3_0111845 [Pseudomonas taeanensis MS-3]|uniref:Sulfotransferase family protein n=1 Tax=Pseudomonas taeanensis MS-3 TaxID=1395571 RepID=A0A0A1YMH9_9PSED|nr:sulfotransferase family 2 domain-containing protein [Pseudomonas taeanensis]KFX70178.1 hypothetical protein TMS3_0111845 [Pseudomonas taeanensis MS-3]
MSTPIFVHIPKTAGSTIRTLITENYQPGEVLSLYGDPKEILTTAASHIGRMQGMRLVQGHTPYGTHRFLGIRNPRYFTFLREPIARFLSEIAYAVRHGHHSFHQVLAAPGLTDSERISKALDIPYFRNTMTHFVSGAFSTETISMTQLGVAIDNLWASEFVGLSECFEISLLIMAKKLGWRHVVPQLSNVRPDDDTISAELRARLVRPLAYDAMLYAVAQEHFAQSRAQYGAILEEAAAQLSELIRLQGCEHPDTRYSMYQVWDAIQIPLDEYQARIAAGSPLYRWLND